MKITNFLALGICLLFGSCTMQKSTVQVNDKGTEWEWNKGTIVVKTPERPAGQESVIGLALPKMEVVRVGFVGLGMRGPGAVSRFTYIPGTQIVALCDYEKERAEKCQKYLKEASLPKAAVYSGDKGYEELCKRDDIDLVYIATDCWELVDLSEKNRKHCMILENCCYDWFEMNTLNMAQHGVFGEVIRAQGAYIHNLAPFWKHYWKKGEDDKLGWRLDYNMRHRGDVYATHGLGPVAQALNIHRGDRMETLVAMDTKSVVGKDLVKENADSVCNSFRNGDHTTTLIRTANGKVIEIQHNVMTPQPYNRLYQLTGTKGFANKYPTQGYALDAEQLKASGVQPKVDDLNSHGFMPREEMVALVEKYQHPILKKYGEMAKEVGGHGGMDFIMDSRLVYCLQNGLPLDMDVYDLAEWCCLAELGELSMDNGCASVAFPDFTRPETRTWWSGLYKDFMANGIDGIWNDMNEPASFNGELPQDVVFTDEDREITHAEMHNIYGHLMSKATYEGLKKWDQKRPFVITRACYAGSQKYTTFWTGDNQSLCDPAAVQHGIERTFFCRNRCRRIRRGYDR